MSTGSQLAGETVQTQAVQEIIHFSGQVGLQEKALTAGVSGAAVRFNQHQPSPKR